MMCKQIIGPTAKSIHYFMHGRSTDEAGLM